MSKWGHVSSTNAKRKFEHDPKDAASMVAEMSGVVVDQEKAIDGLKSQIMGLQTNLMMARSAEAHLNGYVERVRELDPEPSGPGDGVFRLVRVES